MRPRAVSHAQAHSTRCGELRAFVDGSVLADGRMGLAVFYARNKACHDDYYLRSVT